MRSSHGFLAVLILAAVLAPFAVGGAAGHPAHAQVFGPPMTVFGSVTDAEGEVPENLIVEAYVGDRICGRGLTQFTGEGDGRVTVYYADVVSREQTAGCGSPGVEVRIRIGDRFADQATEWRAGPVQLDVTFGDATPAPIPTFTPTPRATEDPGETPVALTPTPTISGTATPAASPSPSPSPSPTATPTITPTPTLSGGFTTREAGAGGSDATSNDDGVPVWIFVVVGLGALVAVGGGVGYMMARSRREPEPLDDEDI